jgi:hypothetical protein
MAAHTPWRITCRTHPHTDLSPWHGVVWGSRHVMCPSHDPSPRTRPQAVGVPGVRAPAWPWWGAKAPCAGDVRRVASCAADVRLGDVRRASRGDAWRVPVARKQGHAPEWIKGMSGVQLKWVLTPRRTTGTRSQHATKHQSPQCVAGSAKGAFQSPPPGAPYYDPRTERLVRGVAKAARAGM